MNDFLLLSPGVDAPVKKRFPPRVLFLTIMGRFSSMFWIVLSPPPICVLYVIGPMVN